MKSKTLITALSVAALALAGCAGTDTQSAGKQLLPIFPDFQDSGLPPMDDDYHPANLDDDGFDPMDGVGIMEPGEYEIYSMEGAHIVFDLPSDPSSDELTEIEQYRKDVQADPVTYIVADVDNREGTDSVNLYEVNVFDEDGNKYEFSDLSEYVSDIAPETDIDGDSNAYKLQNGEIIDGDTGWDLYDKSIDLHNEYLHGADVGERKTIIRVYEGDDFPEEFTRVAVYPNGAFEEAEAFPTDN